MSSHNDAPHSIIRGGGKNKRAVWKGADEPEQKQYGICDGCNMRRRTEWARCPNCGGTTYHAVALLYVAYNTED